MVEENGAYSARVELLTAEVRTVMVGRRQVTLSVYRQLDFVQPAEIEPMGRVHDSQDKEEGLHVIGRHRETGALVRSYSPSPRSEVILDLDYHVAFNAIEILDSPALGTEETPADTTRVGHRTGFSYYKDIPVAEETPGCVILVRRLVGNQHEAQQARYWRYRYGHEEGHRLIASAAQQELAIQRELRELRQWDKLPLIVLAGLR